MHPRILVSVASVIIGAALSLSSVANAAWPSGATRTLPGQTCVVHPFGIDSHGFDCPFVSDYSGTVDTYWGNYNSGIYADFHVNASNDVSVDGCRQSWTGSAAVCASSGETSASTGPVDLGAPGFSTITTGTATEWDYFYTYVSSVGSGVIDQIYGVSYY